MCFLAAAAMAAEGNALIGAANKGSLDVVADLLTRGVDPNYSTCAGWTALCRASMQGHLAVVQLLAASGADPTQQTGAAVPRDWAETFDRTAVAMWLDAVAGLHPFSIATGCRLAAHTRRMLKLGTIDPAGCSMDDVATASSDSLWIGCLPPCPITTQLARDAVAGWTPDRHWIYHHLFREAVHTMMLVSMRLRRGQPAGGARRSVSENFGAGAAAGPQATDLPIEMWHAVCGLLRRRDFITDKGLGTQPQPQHG